VAGDLVREHHSEGGNTIVGRKGWDLTGVMLSVWRWPVAAQWRGDDLGDAVRWLLAAVDGSSSGMVSHPVLRPKPDAHHMYAQDQVVIHTTRM
jgi:hypothetical protein